MILNLERRNKTAISVVPQVLDGCLYNEDDLSTFICFVEGFHSRVGWGVGDTFIWIDTDEGGRLYCESGEHLILTDSGSLLSQSDEAFKRDWVVTNEV